MNDATPTTQNSDNTKPSSDFQNISYSEFISTASHEMRTPIAAIEGYLALLLNPEICTIDAAAEKIVNSARSSCEQLSMLFRNLLDVSRLDENRISVHVEPVNIADFIKQVGESSKFIAAKNDKQFSYQIINEKLSDIDGSHTFLNTDPLLLQEILNNLIENSIKYTGDGGIIALILRIQEDKNIIEVRDNGVGMSEDDISHIFQKFYRANNTDKSRGTGLGLYLVKRYVETLQGTIDVSSEIGKGSIFTITFNNKNENKNETQNDSNKSK